MLAIHVGEGVFSVWKSNQRVLQKQTCVGAMISETEAILLRQRKNFQFLGFLLKQGEKYLNNTVLGVVG